MKAESLMKKCQQIGERGKIATTSFMHLVSLAVEEPLIIIL